MTVSDNIIQDAADTYCWHKW